MPVETGRRLRALRDARGWDKQRMAKELRQAAGEHLADTLPKMIGDWEKGRHKPSERYLYLYRAVFPDFAWRNGVTPAVPDPAAVVESAEQAIGPGLAGLAESARASGRTDLIALAARMEDLQRQVTANTERLRRLLGEASEKTSRQRELTRQARQARQAGGVADEQA